MARISYSEAAHDEAYDRAYFASYGMEPQEMPRARKPKEQRPKPRFRAGGLPVEMYEDPADPNRAILATEPNEWPVLYVFRTDVFPYELDHVHEAQDPEAQMDVLERLPLIEDSQRLMYLDLAFLDLLDAERGVERPKAEPLEPATFTKIEDPRPERPKRQTFLGISFRL